MAHTGATEANASRYFAAMAGIAAVVSVIMTPAPAAAGPVDGTTTGAFSIDNCTGGLVCDTPSANVFSYSFLGIGGNSLTAVATNFAEGSTPAQVMLAELFWENGFSLPGSAELNLDLTISFSVPAIGDQPAGSLDLTLNNFLLAPERLVLPDISGVTLDFGAVEITDLFYELENPFDTFFFVNKLVNRPDGTTAWRLSSGKSEALFIKGTIQAVPEPTTLAVLGLGLVGLGFAVRRRQQRSV